MMVRSGIYGPFRQQRRPRGRFLAQEAYFTMAALAGIVYVLYLVLA